MMISNSTFFLFSCRISNPSYCPLHNAQHKYNTCGAKNLRYPITRLNNFSFDGKCGARKKTLSFRCGVRGEKHS